MKNKWYVLPTAGVLAAMGYCLHMALTDCSGIIVSNLQYKSDEDGPKPEPVSIDDNRSPESENPAISPNPAEVTPISAQSSTLPSEIVVLSAQPSPMAASSGPSDRSTQIRPESPRVDTTWLNGLNPWSIGRKHQEHLILAPMNDPIWTKRAENIRAKLPSENHSGPHGWWTYWRGWVPFKAVDGWFVSFVCRNALSYSEWGTYFTLINARKGYFDFLWETCGRDDSAKPKDWWYA